MRYSMALRDCVEQLKTYVHHIFIFASWCWQLNARVHGVTVHSQTKATSYDSASLL
jgi:hypothetical protein